MLNHFLCVSKTTPLKLNNHLFYLAHLKISIVENCKYPGITISTKNSDLDLKRQMKKIYANANLLLRKFSCCSVSVKCYIFNIYCSTLYRAPMRLTAPKRLKNEQCRYSRVLAVSKQLVHVAYREMFQHQEQHAWIRHIKDLLCCH